MGKITRNVLVFLTLGPAFADPSLPDRGGGHHAEIQFFNVNQLGVVHRPAGHFHVAGQAHFIVQQFGKPAGPDIISPAHRCGSDGYRFRPPRFTLRFSHRKSEKSHHE